MNPDLPPPGQAVAASLEPSLDDVKAHQFCMFPGTSVHVSPELVDVQMFAPKTPATSFVPSLDDAMPLQARFVGPDSPAACVSLSVHVAPESVDVQMFPTLAVAASLVPSLDDVMKCQPRTLGSFSSLACVSLSVQAALAEASEANKSNTASRTRSMVF